MEQRNNGKHASIVNRKVRKDHLFTLLVIANLISFFSVNKENPNENNKVDITEGFLDVHNLVKSEVASPFRFVSLVKTYIKIYTDKKNVIASKQSKLQVITTIIYHSYVNSSIIYWCVMCNTKSTPINRNNLKSNNFYSFLYLSTFYSISRLHSFLSI